MPRPWVRLPTTTTIQIHDAMIYPPPPTNHQNHQPRETPYDQLPHFPAARPAIDEWLDVFPATKDDFLPHAGAGEYPGAVGHGL